MDLGDDVRLRQVQQVGVAAQVAPMVVEAHASVLLLREPTPVDQYAPRPVEDGDALLQDPLEFATGPGFFKVELDRALALVDDAVDVKEIDDERARAQLEAARAELEKVDAGESQADRWQLEQRIVHAENQLAVSGRTTD